MALELSLMCSEGLIFSMLLFVLPFINVIFAFGLILSYFASGFALSVFGATKEKRWDLLFVLPQYTFLKYVNAFIYLETFFNEVILRRKNLVWFKPERIQL